MDLKKMRNEITSLIDDVKFHSDSLTPEHNIPILQLNIILAKMHKMVEQTTILKHYLELELQKDQVEESSRNMEEVIEENLLKEEVQESPPKIIHESSNLPDLKSAIGIYERYLFANELFNTSLEAFDEAISTLNDFESIDKARYYIEEGLKKEFNWEEDNEQVEIFCNLIERRYNR